MPHEILSAADGHHETTTVALGPGRSARLVRCQADVRVAHVVGVLGLSRRPVVVVNGSTRSGSTELPGRALDDAMGSAAAVALETGATLVTGGTNTGVFALLGASLQQSVGGYACVGVVPSATTTWPGRPAGTEKTSPDRAELECHHTHFVVVDGSDWGDETAMMLDLATELAGSHPSVAVLAGGGAIAEHELAGHLRARRPVVVLAGSGRLADRVAGMVESATPLPWAARSAVDTAGLIDVVPLSDASVLSDRLRHHLRPRGPEASDRDLGRVFDRT